jgi:hypothetical protein
MICGNRDIAPGTNSHSIDVVLSKMNTCMIYTTRYYTYGLEPGNSTIIS